MEVLPKAFHISSDLFLFQMEPPPETLFWTLFDGKFIKNHVSSHGYQQEPLRLKVKLPRCQVTTFFDGEYEGSGGGSEIPPTWDG